MDNKFTLLSAAFFAAKNAIATIAASVSVFYATIVLPDISLNAVFWGTLGGLLRWLITRCSLGQGAIYLAIGGLMASGFDGYRIPFLFEILPPEATAQHAAPFFIGTFGIVIYGVFEDMLKRISSDTLVKVAVFLRLMKPKEMK